ncbi:MAG: anti-sigma factor family protein [Draconibacterium sp.]
MKIEEVKDLLQRYFDGESTGAEERMLKAYFQSGEVAEEVAEYAGFFSGISALAHIADDPTIEEDVMDYILENEHREKTRYRSMWKLVTGVAASVIIVLGGLLFYQEQQKSFKDTFQDPDEAYAYASKTLEFVSGKYSKGLAQLSNFDMLHKASDPIKKGTEPVVEFYDELNKIEKQ